MNNSAYRDHRVGRVRVSINIEKKLFALIVEEKDYQKKKRHPANWYRNKVAEELQLADKENPSLRSYEEKIRHIRQKLSETPLDIPWCIGKCLKHGIPGDVIPSLIRIKEAIGDKLTVRRARWIGLLYPAITRLATGEHPVDSRWFEQRLSFIGREYAIREQFCEAMGGDIDTSDFDTLFFTFGDISDEALATATVDNIFAKRPTPQTPHLTSDQIAQIEGKLGKITPNERGILHGLMQATASGAVAQRNYMYKHRDVIEPLMERVKNAGWKNNERSPSQKVKE